MARNPPNKSQPQTDSPAPVSSFTPSRKTARSLRSAPSSPLEPSAIEGLTGPYPRSPILTSTRLCRLFRIVKNGRTKSFRLAAPVGARTSPHCKLAFPLFICMTPFTPLLAPPTTPPISLTRNPSAVLPSPACNSSPCHPCTIQTSH